MGAETLIPAGIGLATTLLGGKQASDKESDARNARNAQLAEFANIKIPTIEEQMLDLAKYQSAGTLTPEAIQLINQGPTALEQIQLDPRLKSAQLSALEQMSGLASGNLSQADLAGFELARRSAANEAQAKQGQIMQEMRARGQGGSGVELIARLQSNESAADRLQQNQLQQAQALQQARMQALQNQSNMASQMTNQEYQQAQNLASARDAIARYNAQNAQQIGMSNVQARNEAERANLAARQALANANIDLSNKQQIQNKDLLQTQFKNQADIAADKLRVYSGIASDADKTAGRISGMWGDIGKAASGAAAAYFNQKKQETEG